jgi:DNA modification methylase
VALTVTSPPYDHLRTYKGNASFDYPAVGRELLRVTVPGGVACVVIQDGTRDYCKTGTSFRMVVNWMDAGWGLWETLIWRKESPHNHTTRFRLDHEYIFCFVNG